MELIISGKRALIDDEDYDLIKDKSVFLQNAKGPSYACINVENKNYKTKNELLHHFLFGRPLPGFEIDHINRNRLDNRKTNLRFVTRGENNRNRRKRNNCSSRFIGVLWNKQSSKWQARITVDKKVIHLGFFADEAMAAKAFDRAVDKYFNGTFYKNFEED